MRISKQRAKELGIEFTDERKGTCWDRQAKGKHPEGVPVVPSPFAQLCVAAGLPLPEEETLWHPTRKWRADFLFGGLVIVEVQGGVWGTGKKCGTCGQRQMGHHSRGQSQIDDMERRNEAQILGYQVLEFTPQQIADGSAIPVILRALEEAGT